MRTGPSLVLAAWGIVVCSGCEHNLVEMPADQPCLDAAYNIAARTFECTGDPDLANARYEAFESEFRCKPVDVETDPVSDYFHCSVTIGALTCEEVEAFGDDIACWFGVSPACPYVVEYADGTPLGQKTTSTVWEGAVR